MPYNLRAAAPAPVKAWAEIVRRIEGLAAQHSNGTLSEPTSMAVGGTTLLISCAPTQLSTEMKDFLLGMKLPHLLVKAASSTPGSVHVLSSLLLTALHKLRHCVLGPNILSQQQLQQLQQGQTRGPYRLQAAFYTQLTEAGFLQLLPELITAAADELDKLHHRIQHGPLEPGPNDIRSILMQQEDAERHALLVLEVTLDLQGLMALFPCTDQELHLRVAMTAPLLRLFVGLMHHIDWSCKQLQSDDKRPTAQQHELAQRAASVLAFTTSQSVCMVWHPDSAELRLQQPQLIEELKKAMLAMHGLRVCTLLLILATAHMLLDEQGHARITHSLHNSSHNSSSSSGSTWQHLQAAADAEKAMYAYPWSLACNEQAEQLLPAAHTELVHVVGIRPMTAIWWAGVLTRGLVEHRTILDAVQTLYGLLSVRRDYCAAAAAWPNSPQQHEQEQQHGQELLLASQAGDRQQQQQQQEQEQEQGNGGVQHLQQQLQQLLLLDQLLEQQLPKVPQLTTESTPGALSEECWLVHLLLPSVCLQWVLQISSSHELFTEDCRFAMVISSLLLSVASKSCPNRLPDLQHAQQQQEQGPFLLCHDTAQHNPQPGADQAVLHQQQQSLLQQRPAGCQEADMEQGNVQKREDKHMQEQQQHLQHGPEHLHGVSTTTGVPFWEETMQQQVSAAVVLLERLLPMCGQGRAPDGANSNSSTSSIRSRNRAMSDSTNTNSAAMQSAGLAAANAVELLKVLQDTPAIMWCTTHDAYAFQHVGASTWRKGNDMHCCHWQHAPCSAWSRHARQLCRLLELCIKTLSTPDGPGSMGLGRSIALICAPGPTPASAALFDAVVCDATDTPTLESGDPDRTGQLQLLSLLFALYKHGAWLDTLQQQPDQEQQQRQQQPEQEQQQQPEQEQEQEQQGQNYGVQAATCFGVAAAAAVELLLRTMWNTDAVTAAPALHGCSGDGAGSSSSSSSSDTARSSAAAVVLPCLALFGRCCLQWAQQLQSRVAVVKAVVTSSSSSSSSSGANALPMYPWGGAGICLGVHTAALDQYGQLGQADDEASSWHLDAPTHRFIDKIRELHRWLKRGGGSAFLQRAGFDGPQLQLLCWRCLKAVEAALQQPLLQHQQDLERSLQAVSVLLQQLRALAKALTSLPFSCACNNPCCSLQGGNMSPLTEAQLVKRHLCSGCRVARFCSTACRDQHWKQHKPVCKALAAARLQAAAAPAAGESQQGGGS